MTDGQYFLLLGWAMYIVAQVEPSRIFRVVALLFALLYFLFAVASSAIVKGFVAGLAG